MVTLLELSTELGPGLAPVRNRSVAAHRLSGVHVSELADPTPYLEGGELLLTTGMPLGGTETATRAYVARLQDKGIHALGVGLGPWRENLPDHLADVCAEAGVELLTVPEGVPFQSVSRAFWRLSARSEQADLMGSLGTQTALARAAVRPGATSAVVRGLAQALGGWAVYLPAGRNPETCWPAGVESLVPQLRAETLRLNRTGAHSAATFELDGQPVVEYPIAIGERIHGFLAIGPGPRPPAPPRQVGRTVGPLLALKARQREVVSGTTAALGGAVTKLLLRGHPDAARMLAEDLGLHALPERVRVLGLRSGADGDAHALVRGARSLRRDDDVPPLPPAVEDCLLRHEEADVLYLVVADAPVPPGEDSALPGAPPGPAMLAGALTEPVSLGEVPETLVPVRQALRRAAAGSLVSTGNGPDAQAQRWVRTLAAHSRTDLVGTVRAYLRHRGHWEDASRELGIHRNSLRHRIATAESLLQADLDDPDVFSPLWLALRRGGQ